MNVSSAGQVFGIFWLVIAMPVYAFSVYMFWRRREIQPIKARSPYLVLVCDIVLVVFVLVLCLQRIFVDDYPCLLNVWAAFIGTLVLCNTYLLRCWHLYFTYRVTQEKLKASKVIRTESSRDLFRSGPTSDSSESFAKGDNHDSDSANDKSQGSLADPSSFSKYQKYTRVSSLVKILGVVTLFLLIPCVIITNVKEELKNSSGDNCDKRVADIVLGVYAGIYILCFAAFAFNLRQVVDAFMIKEELRFTALVGVLAVLPWFLFNNAFRDVNVNVFPFSTLVLVLAVTFAMGASTFYPLYRSVYSPPPLDDLNVPADMATLRGLISDPDGFESFKEFLSKEFSVENILFWKEVEDFRQKKAQSSNNQLVLMQEAQNIYAKYIIPGSPLQVNLPGQIFKDLQTKLKVEYGGMAHRVSEDKKLQFETIVIDPSAVEKTTTVFDLAQKNIFYLMETDSYKRYITTKDYADILQHYANRARKKEVLMEMNVL